ncbi:myosin phosphatase Rho-interacting protein isoform X2 [Pangasianodon hypophthalmus]|uniref:myosin phosphatase Rho-interacting protein isoform X2 n=1 Tax=Pangasianodon hypophthalmus TaxID=310915 RepID=UPI0023075F65|nr:myosin phosphatase Rho-interacting protein isoform X2 [Pangasianodon hypophthalmus]
MSLVKMEVSCNKFQANVFDQSRCQNCFKSRELHVTTREEMEQLYYIHILQVKPIYASWLCLAPEGLDFDSPMQRSRKWQRRFFILYEHGCLEFALDELPSTVPQGTVNLHQCTDVIDAEDRTGQKNTLCIITPDQEIYIRGDSKEIISGWCEQLLVFRQTNEQRRRKKGSRTPVPSQEEASIIKPVCSIGAAYTGTVEDNKLRYPREEDEPSEKTEDMNVGQDVNVTTPDSDSLGSGKLKTHDINQETFSVDTHQAEGGSSLQLSFHHHPTSVHSPEPWRTVTRDLSPSDLPLNSSASHSLHWQEDDAENCAKKHTMSSSLAKHMTQDQENTEELHAGTQEDKNGKDSCFITCSMPGDECWTNENEKQCKMCPECSSRSQTGHIQNTEKSVGLLEAPQSNIPPLRRLQTVEIKASESTMTPDLLNFKKGWLFMDDHDRWRKYWFVLSAHSLRYYFDSGAEEVSQLVGEIDLTTCHRVTELHDQRNFGFELWTHRMVYKLATTTAGKRQNWIQALTKNIQDQNAPDVASIPDNCPSRVGPHSGPDVTQESMSLSCPVNEKCCTKQRSDHYRRRRGRPKTSRWTDMLIQEGTREQERVEQNAEESISRRRGREERRQRYAIVMGSSVCPLDERNSSTQENQQQERMREIEECWLQVEKMAIREEKRVLLYPEYQSEDSVELKKLLEHYGKRMEELTVRSESANQEYSQDHAHGTDWSLGEPTCDPGTEWEPQKIGPNKQNPSLTDKYQEPKGLVSLKDLRRQQISDLLDLYPLSQSNSEFTNEPKRKSECNLLHQGITSDKPIKSLSSLGLCQASRDLGDDPTWARMFSERTALMIREGTVSDQAMVKLLSQEAEFLTRQNEALNQRNQELVNQLAEADREIDRLKAELFSQPNGHQPELESIVECLELELARSCGQLQEAQTQLAEMEDNLKDTHQTLQLKEATLRGLGLLNMDSEYKIAFPEIIDRLHQCVQVLEFKVSELVSQQWLSTLTCKELQTQNTSLMKLEVQNSQKIMEDDTKNMMLERELESNIPLCEGLAHTKDEQHQNRIETVEVALKKRSNVFSLLIEVIRQLAGNEMPESVSEHETAQMNPKVLRRLQLEKDIWESFVNTLKSATSDNLENEEAACLLRSAEMKLGEVKMYLSALSIYKSISCNPLTLSSNSGPDNSGNTSSSNPDIIGINDGKMEKEQNNVMWKGLKEHMEKRLILIDHVTSKLESFTNNETLSEITRQFQKTNTFYPIISVVMDIMAAYLVEKLSHSVIMQKSVAIQTENQEMLEQNIMAVNEKPEVSEGTGKETITYLKSRIKELEHLLSERLTSLQQQHEKDKERLKVDIMAGFEQGITLLRESHRKATEVLLLKHQREQELLKEEKERLLTEEVAACLTVIETMKRAHSSELEKMLQKACREKTYSGGTNIDVILKNHSEELSAVQRELDALSEQYTQKCLENMHLAEALQAERDALQQYQCQNLALSAHNQELTSHLAEEIMRLSTVAKDGCNHDREQYELMIKLQVKEFCQEQEIDILKNELYAAKMDQKVASERFQEIQTELNLVKETAEQQISQLNENLRLVYEALEESIKKTTPATPLAASSQPVLFKS